MVVFPESSFTGEMNNLVGDAYYGSYYDGEDYFLETELEAGETKTYRIKVKVVEPYEYWYSDTYRIYNEAKVYFENEEENEYIKINTNLTKNYIMQAPIKLVLNDKSFLEMIMREMFDEPEMVEMGGPQNLVGMESRPSMPEIPANTNSSAAGKELIYVILARNLTEEEKELELIDILPEDVEFIEAIGDNVVYEKGTLTWKKNTTPNERSNLPLNSMIIALVKVRVKKSAQDKVITNEAILRCDNVEEKSEATKTDIVRHPMKEVYNEENKEINGRVVKAGDILTYKIKVKNPTERNKYVFITDQLPENVELISASGLAIYNGRSMLELELLFRDEEIIEPFIWQNPYFRDLVESYYEEDNEENIEEQKRIIMELIEFLKDSNLEDKNVLFKKIADVLKKIEPAEEIISDLPEGFIVWIDKIYGNQEKEFTIKVKVKEDAKGTIVKNEADVIVAGEQEGFDESHAVKAPMNMVGAQSINNYTIAGPEFEFKTNETLNPVAIDPIKRAYNVKNQNIDKKIAEVDGEIKYKIIVTNPAEEEKTLKVEDIISEDFEFVSANNGGVYENGRVIWILENVEAKKAITLTLVVKPKKEADGKNVQNIAKMTILGKGIHASSTDLENDDFKDPRYPWTYRKTEEEEETKIDTNGTNINIINPVMTIGKEENKDQDRKIIDNNEEIIYEITFKNPYNEEKEFVVEDVIPEGLEVVEIYNGGIDENGKIIWKFKLGPGEDIVLKLKTKVKDNFNGKKITNKAVLYVNGEEDKIEIQTNEVAIFKVVIPEKKVLNSKGENIDKKNIKAGEELIYVITIENPSNKAKEFVIEDKLSKDLEFIEASHECEKKEDVLIWKINVEAGKKEDITIKVKVKDTEEGAKISNIAEVTVDGIKKQTEEVEITVNKEEKQIEEKKEENKEDNTKADGKIPYTGQRALFGTGVALIVISSGLIVQIIRKRK